MIRTHVIKCDLDRGLADSLNKESGRIYSDVMVHHWRAFNLSAKHWVSKFRGMKWSDWRDREQSNLLHAHSVDAAQEAFHKACKTAKACIELGTEGVRYPHRRHYFRTTIWKNTGIRKRDGRLLLSLARGNEPLMVKIPSQFNQLPKESFVEMRLVYDIVHSKYRFHLVIDDGKEAAVCTGTNVAAIDLGEIHPAVATDGTEGMVFSCRELRSVAQGTSKRLASITSKMSKLQRGSRRYRALKRRKAKFLAKQKLKRTDLEHKISRSIVDWTKEREVGVIAIGNVRNIADKTKEKKRLGRKTRQKVSNWSHGKLRSFIGYKAESEGMKVDDKVDEAYTSQTCPQCSHRHKPKGRNYFCSACGFRGHRDIVGASNILSRFTTGELGRVITPITKYRKPFQRWNLACVVPRTRGKWLEDGFQEATAIYCV